MAMVTDAIHGADHMLMSASDSSRKEIQLIVPGPLWPGGAAVSGFSHGFIYVYWPEVAFDLHSVGGKVTLLEGEAATKAIARGSIEEVETRNLTISVGNDRITQSGNTSAGPYVITIQNDSSMSRGIMMSGIDGCGSPYHRFSHILRPGEKISFRWYFSPGQVTVKDVESARRTGRSFSDVRYGLMSTTVSFQ